jgi:Mg/Co/Ni transporter MgtE
MSRRHTLTLAYLAHAPQSAARVLQGLPTDDAVAFLETVPARLSAPVVNAMTPWEAAQCLEKLSPARAAAILRGLPFQDSASLLRLVGAAPREAILDELPIQVARRHRSSLRYPRSQVGAWINPDVPVLRPSDSAGTALKHLGGARVTASHVFLESADGRFAGVICTRDLLAHRADRPLGELPIGHIAPLSNRASLAAAAFNSHWDEFLFLPVVGRRDTVLGGLSRAGLRKGIQEQHARDAVEKRTVFGYLLNAFFVAAAGLFRLGAQATEVADHQPGGVVNRGK